MAKGEHLRVRRLLYWHHAIDEGGGTVIQFSGEPLGKHPLKIERVSLEQFLQGEGSEVVPHPKADPPEVVVNRAISRIGETGYSVVSNNCEHFATWCMTGRKESPQVRSATAGAIGGIAAGFVARRLVLRVAVATLGVGGPVAAAVGVAYGIYELGQWDPGGVMSRFTGAVGRMMTRDKAA